MNLLTNAKCFIAIYKNIPVAFIAITKLYSPHSQNIFRGHRVVTLPDYQGVGIGWRLVNFIAEYLKKQNFRFVWTSSNPSLIHVCQRSPLWKLTHQGRKPPHTKFKSRNSPYKGSEKRVITSWEYIGGKK